jgi:hypothetical protein
MIEKKNFHQVKQERDVQRNIFLHYLSLFRCFIHLGRRQLDIKAVISAFPLKLLITEHSNSINRI